MSQPSVLTYFKNRKRTANDEIKGQKALKLIRLDDALYNKNDTNNNIDNVPATVPIRPATQLSQKGIEQFLGKKQCEAPAEQASTTPAPQKTIPTTAALPTTSLEGLKKKITKSSRLEELRARIDRFNEKGQHLKKAEERTRNIEKQPNSPKLDRFKSIEIDVPLSPSKTPEKPYLSPLKDTTKRQIFSGGAVAQASRTLNFSASKDSGITNEALKLPFKYRYLSELFAAMDIVAQIMYNRSEAITFTKIKAGVEKLLKRSLHEKHLAQIARIYPKSYEINLEKVKNYSNSTTHNGSNNTWELVLKPVDLIVASKITESVLLERKKNLHSALLELTKGFHKEFLAQLTPPIVVDEAKLKRWHPEFNTNQVPDVELAELPKVPEVVALSGKEILDRAHDLFAGNNRIKNALERMQKEADEKQEKKGAVSETLTQNHSILKGIPAALLAKVRQKQSEKIMASITKSADKEKEAELYARLPEIGRIARNVFVAEKKFVLPLECVLDRVGNSYNSTLNKDALETHLRRLSAALPEWLTLTTVRNVVYVRLEKNADVSKVLKRLHTLADEKNQL